MLDIILKLEYNSIIEIEIKKKGGHSSGMVEIMRKFTKNEMINGELAIRSLSEKAQKFCNETDPLEVYERLIYPEELENEIVTYEKRYYVRGCLGNFDDMTLDELNELFEDFANEFAEDEEI